jgi:hypothetical protein
VSAYSSSTSPIQNAYEKLDSQFNQLVKESRRTPVSESNVEPAWISKLQQAARSTAWNETVGDYVMRRHPEDMKHLRDQYQKRTLLLEKELLEKELSQKPAKSANRDYKQLNSSFADLEARLAGMDHSSKAVFVGSGPQPNSVFAYANHAGSVTGIDIDPEAIALARNIEQSSAGKIDFQEQAGEKFNYKPYTHVGIAVMVPDKAKILEQIQKTANSGCTVIVRSVDGLKNAMYERFDPSAQKGFEQIATLHGTDQNITHATILRTKKPLNIVA